MISQDNGWTFRVIPVPPEVTVCDDKEKLRAAAERTRAEWETIEPRVRNTDGLTTNELCERIGIPQE